MVKRICVLSFLALACLFVSANLAFAAEISTEADNITAIEEINQRFNPAAVPDPAHLDVGFELGWPFYGLKMVCWQGNNGYGLNYYQLSGFSSGWGSSSSNTSTHFSVRYYYKFKPNTYVSIGLGKYDYSYTSTYDDYSWLTSTAAGTHTESYNYSENLFGISAGVKASDYIMYEIGYGMSSGKNSTIQSRVTYSITTYFNLF